MGRTTGRIPGFCLSRVSTPARVRSPPAATKPIPAPCHSANEGKDLTGSVKKGGELLGRRIMIVGESSPDVNTALQWALSHTVQSHDTILLLDVVKPGKHGAEAPRTAKDYGILNAMKNICQVRRPEVQVELSLAEGKDRGPTIVEEARKQGASLLVLGQKKRLITWRLLVMWVGNRMGGGVADYCVQNSTCMALAVRRKGRKSGGYLITTRRHKDFWLLA